MRALLRFNSLNSKENLTIKRKIFFESTFCFSKVKKQPHKCGQPKHETLKAYSSGVNTCSGDNEA